MTRRGLDAPENCNKITAARSASDVQAAASPWCQRLDESHVKFLRIGDKVSSLTFTSSGKGHFHRFQRTKTNVPPKSESGRLAELACAPSSSPDLSVFGDQCAHCDNQMGRGAWEEEARHTGSRASNGRPTAARRGAGGSAGGHCALLMQEPSLSPSRAGLGRLRLLEVGRARALPKELCPGAPARSWAGAQPRTPGLSQAYTSRHAALWVERRSDVRLSSQTLFCSVLYLYPVSRGCRVLPGS